MGTAFRAYTLNRQVKRREGMTAMLYKILYVFYLFETVMHIDLD